MSRQMVVHVGMDVHRDRIVWCAVSEEGEVVSQGRIATTVKEVVELVRDWQGWLDVARVYYEAGPCGYWLYRVLVEEGLECMVVAPGLTPRRASKRVKTDRTDALELAVLGMRGLLTAVRTPTEQEEDLRELLRVAVVARREVAECKTRITHFLNRRGIVYRRGKRWTRRHRRWLREIELPPTGQIALEGMIEELEWKEARQGRLEAQLRGQVSEGPWEGLIERLQVIRGVGWWTAVTIALEVWRRGGICQLGRVGAGRAL